ncbi:hypothetical protein PC128_g26010 [Phytophthora cactorum]|nr:hypothetical protein PC128_g26010 [Phytophthora cactorum]
MLSIDCVNTLPRPNGTVASGADTRNPDAVERELQDPGAGVGFVTAAEPMLYEPIAGVCIVVVASLWTQQPNLNPKDPPRASALSLTAASARLHRGRRKIRAPRSRSISADCSVGVEGVNESLITLRRHLEPHEVTVLRGHELAGATLAEDDAGAAVGLQTAFTKIPGLYNEIVLMALLGHKEETRDTGDTTARNIHCN